MIFKIYVNNEEQVDERTSSIFDAVHNADIWVNLYENQGYEITNEDDFEIRLVKYGDDIDRKTILIVME